MNLQVRFENHLGEKVVEIFFENGFACDSAASLEELKRHWSENLKKWHSPYTCIFDCRKLRIAPELEASFARLIKFFQNFFMRKIIGFVDENENLTATVPFEVVSGYENAVKQTGLSRSGGLTRNLSDLRSRIHIDNDFSAHVMEVSFLADTDFLTAQDVHTLKEKLQNILMLWHTPYSVVFNLTNCTFSEEGAQSFAKVERFLKSFFCKNIVGYAPKAAKESYPFPVFRARHKAVGSLENEGLNSGDKANCSTRKKKTAAEE